MDTRVFRGRLDRWNDDRGFGFIGSKNGKRDIFIHISAFKRVGPRPVVGDTILFEIHTGNDGKTRAVNARIDGVTTSEANTTPRPPQRKQARRSTHPRHSVATRQRKSRFIFPAIIVVLLMSAATGVYERATRENTPTVSAKPTNNPAAVRTKQKPEFSCEGKTHCSHMTSCDEARFYIRNCPGTQMDGDGDGIPCERQWCTWQLW